MGEAGGGLLGNLPAKTLHEGAGETSPPAFAAPYLPSLSRILFVFCFQRDPHGLSHPFQKAKLLVTFKSVCMGPSYLDRAGTFSCVPRAPGAGGTDKLCLSVITLALFFALTDKRVCPCHQSHSGKGPSPVRCSAGRMSSICKPMQTLLNVIKLLRSVKGRDR
jgi:hypothetical protein